MELPHTFNTWMLINSSMSLFVNSIAESELRFFLSHSSESLLLFSANVL